MSFKIIDRRASTRLAWKEKRCIKFDPVTITNLQALCCQTCSAPLSSEQQTEALAGERAYQRGYRL